MTNPTAPLELTVWRYHDVRDGGDAADAGAGNTGLPVARLAEQLDEMAPHNHMLAWPEVRAAVAEGRSLPPDSTLLTFDDGLRDHYLNVFPLLKERGLSGLFFGLARPPGAGLALPHKIQYLLPVLGQARLRAEVYQRLRAEQQDQFREAEARYETQHDMATPRAALDMLTAVLQRDVSGPAEGILSDLIARHVGDEIAIAREHYLQPEQVSEMAAGGMHFGGHSASHPWFDFICPEQQAQEIMASAGWLSGVEPGPWAFAYPYGGRSPLAPLLLAEHGFVAAFTAEARLRHSDPYKIGRLDGAALVAVKIGEPHG